MTIDDTTAASLSRSLTAGTSVSAESNGPNADLAVQGNIQWSGNSSLTLGATRNVSIGPMVTITNKGAGGLALRADAGGIDTGGSVINGGTIDWSKSTGIVSVLFDINQSFSPGTLLTNSGWTAAPYSGQVTQITAYKLINSYADLLKVSQNLAGNYALGRDIDASASHSTIFSGGSGFQPLGPTETASFTGQFDGFGHTIDSLGTIGPAFSKYVGLFGVIGSNGVVRNLKMTHANAAGSENAAYGILAGRNDGTVAYVSTAGNAGTSSYGGLGNGGLVGQNNGLIERSSSSAGVGSQSGSGGLVGSNDGTITQSFATGGVGGGTHGVQGGLAASNAGLITQSYATGGAGGYRGGGLVYSNTPTGVINESFATGSVGGGPPDDPYGGIAATNEGAIHNNVYWNRDATGRTSAAFANSGTVPPNSNGLTTAQMSNVGNYLDWNIPAGGVWAMPKGSTHPVLQWQQARP